jgi:hypothetical protein
MVVSLISAYFRSIMKLGRVKNCFYGFCTVSILTLLASSAIVTANLIMITTSKDVNFVHPQHKWHAPRFNA